MKYLAKARQLSDGSTCGTILNQLAGQPRSASAERPRGEESPGSTETRCRITSGGGDPRESATESRPPSSSEVRVKGWGKSPPRTWRHGRHGKPHREQDRIGMTRTAQAVQPVSGPVIRVGCTRPGASPVPDEWLPRSDVSRSHTEPGLQANWRFSPDRHGDSRPPPKGAPRACVNRPPGGPQASKKRNHRASPAPFRLPDCSRHWPPTPISPSRFAIETSYLDGGS
jgi:hypothetical protein